MKLTSLSAIFFISWITISSDPVTIVTKADRELIPEGIAIHPTTGTIYLSSLHKNKIVAIEKDGTVKDLIASGANGYMMGLGLKVDAAGKTLWALSAYNDSTKHRAGLFQIDLKSGKVLQTFIRSEVTDCFFNDLVIDKNGNIYITDTHQSSVFRWDAKTKNFERWLQDSKLHWANGITLSPDEKTLFVASADNGIQAINIADKSLTPIAGRNTDFYSIDGLGYYNNTLVGVVGWPQNRPKTHRVLQYHLSPDNKLVKLDTLSINKPEINCPTTLAINKDQLYVLATTNLGIYNRYNSKTDAIKDSLQPALILQYALNK